MANGEVTKAKTLEERITSRIHDSIADLMTDDDLRQIVERGVEQALFQTRRMPNRSSTYGPQYTEKPALVEELVEKHLATSMANAVEAWLRDNPERIQAAVDGAIARGAGESLLRAVDRRFDSIFPMLLDNLHNSGLLPR